MALLITPYFGFETVPQMVEEGDFPIKNSKKAICGSILTCGCIYVFYYFCVAGLDGLQDVYVNYCRQQNRKAQPENRPLFFGLCHVVIF